MKKLISALFGLLFIGTAPAANLPAGYTELEYIQSNGTQYIDTELTINAGEIQATAIYTPLVFPSQEQNYSGVFGTNSNLQAAYTYQGMASIGNNSGNTIMFTIGKQTKLSAVFSQDAARGTYYVDDVDTGLRRAMSLSLSILLFDTDRSNRYPAIGKLYSFVAVRNGATIMNMVPARKNDGTVGLYDTTGKKFYATETGDNFIAGPAIKTCDNLFDGEWMSSTQNNAKATNKNPIFLEPGRKYVATWNGDIPALNVYVYDVNGNLINEYVNNASINNSPFSNGTGAWLKDDVFTVPLNISYIFVTTFGSNASAQQQEWAESLQILPFTCVNKIQVATKKYNDTAFSPVMTALNGAIATIKTVVTNTINQAAAVESLLNGKQTMPNASATNGTCPNYKQCLLVETSDGKPQWFVITDPFRDFVTPILATNTNGTTTSADPGYQQVEYLQSSGTQYIDAMYIPSVSGYEYDIDVATLDGSSAVIGCQANDALLYAMSNGTRVVVLIKGSSVTFSVNTALERFYKHNLSYDGTKYIYKVNGEIIGEKTVAINPLPYFLFGNTRTSGSEVYDLGSVRIGKAKLYNNGTLVRDFVPVLNKGTGKYGMYDKVSKTFFGNDGEGDFTAGPNVTNDANVPSVPTWSVTWSNNGNSESGTVYGEGKCNNSSSDATNTTEGAQCWCKATGVTIGQESSSVSSAPWFFLGPYGSAAGCASDCAFACVFGVSDFAEVRTAVFNTGS